MDAPNAFFQVQQQGDSTPRKTAHHKTANLNIHNHILEWVNDSNDFEAFTRGESQTDIRELLNVSSSLEQSNSCLLITGTKQQHETYIKQEELAAGDVNNEVIAGISEEDVEWEDEAVCIYMQRDRSEMLIASGIL